MNSPVAIWAKWDEVFSGIEDLPTLEGREWFEMMNFDQLKVCAIFLCAIETAHLALRTMQQEAHLAITWITFPDDAMPKIFLTLFLASSLNR